LIELFLMRHGIALELGEGGVFRDQDRPLSQNGRRKMREATAGIRGLTLGLDIVLSSPLLRCRQTAEIVASGLGLPEKVHLLEALAPGQAFSSSNASTPAIIDALGAFTFQRVLLVGHMPDLSELASWLLAGHRGLNLEFKRGTLCLIEVTSLPPRGPGLLRWSVTPRQLRELGKER
jgi:phosphohistidine phosphatase